jgi:hypothetical protein
MEYFAIVFAVGAIAVAFHAGLSFGRSGVLTRQKRRIDERFAVGSNDPFRQTYGVAGLYVADINSVLVRAAPLVIIQSSDFTDLIARRQAGADAGSAELSRIKDKLSDDYLLNSGMSPRTLADIKRVSGRDA